MLRTSDSLTVLGVYQGAAAAGFLTPVAAVMDGRVEVAGKRVGIILSRGNVDLSRLPWNG
jgi:threonine dehydratase